MLGETGLVEPLPAAAQQHGSKPPARSLQLPSPGPVPVRQGQGLAPTSASARRTWTSPPSLTAPARALQVYLPTDEVEVGGGRAVGAHGVHGVGGGGARLRSRGAARQTAALHALHSGLQLQAKDARQGAPAGGRAGGAPTRPACSSGDHPAAAPLPNATAGDTALLLPLLPPAHMRSQTSRRKPAQARKRHACV